MTYKEAIDYFKRRKTQLGLADTIQQAEDLAIKALEKQIPKKPNYEYEQTGNGISSVIRFPICPSCNGIDDGEQYSVGVNEKFCCNCGQALDWSDKE